MANHDDLAKRVPCPLHVLGRSLTTDLHATERGDDLHIEVSGDVELLPQEESGETGTTENELDGGRSVKDERHGARSRRGRTRRR